MLEYSKHFFNTTIDEDSSNKRLKDITHDLARLEYLDFTIVHLEIFLERVANVAI